MSNTQFLNLDDLAPVRRAVQLFGQSYAVKEMTVEHFVEMNQLADEMEAKKDLTPADSIAATVRSIALSLDGCDEAVIRKLSIEQLGVLSQFIRGEFTPQVVQEAAAEGNAEPQPTQG